MLRCVFQSYRKISPSLQRLSTSSSTSFSSFLHPALPPPPLLPRHQPNHQNLVHISPSVPIAILCFVGSQRQKVTMVLDRQQALPDPLQKIPNFISFFNPLASKSYSPIPCSSPVCWTWTRDFPTPVF